jgi:hypothetical protein
MPMLPLYMDQLEKERQEVFKRLKSFSRKSFLEKEVEAYIKKILPR